jgi:hypothetical protein
VVSALIVRVRTPSKEFPDGSLNLAVSYTLVATAAEYIANRTLERSALPVATVRWDDSEVGNLPMVQSYLAGLYTQDVVYMVCHKALTGEGLVGRLRMWRRLLQNRIRLVLVTVGGPVLDEADRAIAKGMGVEFCDDVNSFFDSTSTTTVVHIPVR